jgi:hypothetical protein
MWKHLIHGNVSVDHQYIAGEAFLINGNVIAYFLPLPALIRGFFSSLSFGEYPLPSILTAIAIYAIAVYYLFRDILANIALKNKDSILKICYPFLLIPLISLFVESSVYWESIIWGLSLFTLLTLFFLKYIKNPCFVNLLSINIIASLALFTRPTYIVAVAILIFVSFLFDFNSKRYKHLPIYFIFLISFLFLGLLNYAKFGNIFEFSPLQYHEQLLNTERGKMAAIYQALSFKRIPDAIVYYFGIFQGNLNFNAPFIHGVFHDLVFNYYYFDYREMNYSLPLIFPFHLMLSYFGFLSFSEYRNPLAFFKTTNVLAIINFVPGFLILMITAMSLRYRGEFLPIIIFMSIFGCIYVARNYERNIKKIMISISIFSFLFVVLGLLSERYYLYSIFRCSSKQFFNCAVFGS